MRVVDPRTVVLLEGLSDCQALDPHVDNRQCRTIPGHSKSAVEQAVSLAEQAGVERVLAVVDADFVGVLTTTSESSNVVYSDGYDLDATITLAGDVFERVLAATTDRDRVAEHNARTGVSCREGVVRVAGKIGIARLVSVRDELALNLTRFPVHAVTTSDDTDVELAQLATVLVGRSAASTTTQSDLLNRLTRELLFEHDWQRLSNGHDVANAFATLIHRAWGGTKMSGGTIEQFARAALSCANLRQTRVYNDVARWATRVGTKVWSCED